MFYRTVLYLAVQFYLQMRNYDSTCTGIIEPHELRAALAQLGVHIDLEEAKKLTKKLVTKYLLLS